MREGGGSVCVCVCVGWNDGFITLFQKMILHSLAKKTHLTLPVLYHTLYACWSIWLHYCAIYTDMQWLWGSV